MPFKPVHIKFIINTIIGLVILFPWLCTQLFSQTSVSYRPENFLGSRSNNYQHIIYAKISDKFSLTNFSYLDSDYNGAENLYNVRNVFSYRFLKNWSSNIAFGLKNPGLYGTVSIQLNHSYDLISYVLVTGLTYQNGFTSESFGSISFTPEILQNVKLYLRATFSFNVNLRGVTRGVQQFRVGILQSNISYGIASNLDQFNYNMKKLQNYGVFLNVTF